MVWPLTSPQDSPAAVTAKPNAAEHLIYAHFPGIQGSVTDQGYEGYMLLKSMQVSRSFTIASVMTQGRLLPLSPYSGELGLALATADTMMMMMTKTPTIVRYPRLRPSLTRRYIRSEIRPSQVCQRLSFQREAAPRAADSFTTQCVYSIVCSGL
jgi:hypothetical protein